MLDFDTAQDRLLQAAVRPTSSERISIHDALGRVSADNIHAQLDIPPADNSAMDGYAIRYSDYKAGTALPIQQRCYAGDVPEPLKRGHAIRLFTGSLLPEGADTVVIQEDCNEANDQVSILSSPTPKRHVRYRGEDMSKGKTIILKGKPLTSGHIAILASQGITEINVYPIPKIGILTTGDELAELGRPLKEGQIYNSNAPMLAAQITQLHAKVHLVLHAKDTMEDIQTALARLSTECDLVLTVGGVSVGDKDLVKPAIENMGGTMALWKVRMKPGKPVALAHINKTPIVGLPGNPVSSYAVFTLMVSPMIRVLQGRKRATPRVVFGKLDSNKSFFGSREEFIRVQARADVDGFIYLTPHEQQGSAIISSLAWATGLARIVADKEVKNGDTIAYYDFKHWGF